MVSERYSTSSRSARGSPFLVCAVISSDHEPGLHISHPSKAVADWFYVGFGAGDSHGLSAPSVRVITDGSGQRQEAGRS